MLRGEIRNRSASDGEQLVRKWFVKAVLAWQRREENWSVGVKKDSVRATFSVPKELTKTFFADRIKIVGPTGATRKIVHYVHEHERVTATGTTTVKEHIRGLSEFAWNGYKCRVTAPKFNGRLSTEFDIPCEESEDEDDAPTPKGLMDVEELAEQLAAIEEGATHKEIERRMEFRTIH